MAGSVNPGEQLVTALYVDDVGEAVTFYQSLGFTVVRDEGTFVELRWDEALLFLVEKQGRPTNPPYRFGDLRILVPDVYRHWELARQKGLKVISPLADRSYGLRDFLLAGPGGLAIRFATRLSDLEPRSA